jgi:hypothetical protein
VLPAVKALKAQKAPTDVRQGLVEREEREVMVAQVGQEVLEVTSQSWSRTISRCLQG